MYAIVDIIRVINPTTTIPLPYQNALVDDSYSALAAALGKIYLIPFFF